MLILQHNLNYKRCDVVIGVCIKYFHENYGGMLQAFATVTLLEKKGIKYELIRYEKEKKISTIIKSIPRLLNVVLLNDKKEVIKKKIGIKCHPEFAQKEKIRKKAFEVFNKNHFTNLSPVFYGFESLKKGAYRYDTVLSGSDQLWSPAGLPTNFYNLMFVPEEVRKISYASSFGVTEIPWFQIKRTRKYLNRFDYISMRENRGAEIVKKLTGKRVPIVLDPVFMLDKDEWNEKIPFKAEFNKPYIFAYFLGKNKEYRKAVDMTAKSLKCKVIVLRHLDQYIEEDENFGDYSPYNVGPDKFLNLLRGAEYVCTDSFHGSCFSLIYSKKFVVFNRYSEKSSCSKNSRIDSLCENLGVTSRRYNNSLTLEEQLIKEINYGEVKKRIKERVIKANEYLDVALKGIK